MQTIRTEIADGINLCHIKTDKFKQVLFNIGFTSKLTPELAAQNALLTAVLTKSCAKFPKMEDFNRELDRLYAADINGGVRKFGEVHYPFIEASALQNKYIPDGEDVVKETVELALSALFEPNLTDGVFPSDIVESEKKNLIDLINSAQNNKDSYAVIRCGQVMCENEKYSTFNYGTVEAVEAITPEILTERYNQAISSARFEIYFVGDYDEFAFADIIRNAFSSVRRVLSVDQPGTKARRKPSGEVKRVTENQNITQSKLALGFRLGRSLLDRNYSAMLLVAEIYGASPNSKLFVNVREKLSLCYYCSPVIEDTKGIMIVASAIEAQNKEKAEAEILAQLQKMKDGEITDEELKNAKDSLINKLSGIEDSAAGMISWYSRRGIMGFVDSPDLAVLATQFFTKQQVIEAVKEISLDTVYFLTGSESGEDVE